LHGRNVFRARLLDEQTNRGLGLGFGLEMGTENGECHRENGN